MKKWLLLFFSILIIGGGGYFGFKAYKERATPTTGQQEEEVEPKTQNEVIKREGDVNTPTETHVETNKMWEFSFDEELDPETLQDTDITIKDTNNKIVNTSVQLVNGNKTIQISPPTEGYEEGSVYHLHINKGLNYSTGEPVSKPFDLAFETERKEVEEAKLNENLVVVKKSQVDVIDRDTIKVDQSVKKDLKQNDIIIIPSKENEEGQAVKVVSSRLNNGQFTVQTTEPSFSEIYEELNVNKLYTIEPEDIELEEGVEGVSINPIGMISTQTMVAASNTNVDEPKKEYFFPSIKTKYSKSEGFEIKLEDMQVKHNGKNLAVDGSLAVMNPKIDADIQIKKFKLKKMKLALQNHLEQDTEMQLSGGEKSFKMNLGKEVKPNFKKSDALKKKIKIGKAKIPTSIPGLKIKLGVYLHVSANVSGEQKISTSIELDSEKGFVYENGDAKFINKFEPDLNLGYRGNSLATATSGPLFNAELSAFSVLGSGLEYFAGPKVEGQFSAGILTEQPYTCGRFSRGISSNLNAFVDVSIPFTKEKRILEHEMGTKDFLKKEVNTCSAYNGIESKTKSISLKAGEDISIDILTDYLNLLNSKHTKEEIKDYSLLKVSSSNDNVVEIKKKKKGLDIKALKEPNYNTTNLTLKYTVTNEAFSKKKTGSLTIPITIQDFKKPVDKKEPTKESSPILKKRTVDKEEYAYLIGDWSTDTQHGGGLINIKKVFNDGIEFELNASRGGHAGGVEGKAYFTEEETALYVDEESQCNVNMVLTNKDAIQVYESPECSTIRASGVVFEGLYKKGIVENQKHTLYEQGILQERHDLMIQDLVGDDYDLFVDSTEQYHEGEDLDDGGGARVVFGGVRGLYTYMEAAYIFDTQGNVYAAVIVDGKKVRFYTDNDYYKDHLPETIEKWRSRFSDYPVEIIYKKIPLR